MITQGYSLDSLDGYAGGAYNLDTLPFSLDSRVWTGGQLLMGAFTTQHKLAYFTGAPGIASADTVEIEPYGATGQRAFISTTRPLADAGSPTVQIGTRNRLIDSPSFSTAVAINSNGECPGRADGRYVRARVSLSGSFSHLQGVEIPDFAIVASGRK